MAAPMEVGVRAARNKLCGKAPFLLSAKQSVGWSFRYGWTIDPQECSLQTRLEWSQDRFRGSEMLPN
jgi:hypothetical protein